MSSIKDWIKEDTVLKGLRVREKIGNYLQEY